MEPTEDEIQRCLATLEASRALSPDDARFLALEQAAAHLRKHAKRKRRLARKRASAARDRARREATGLAAARGIDAGLDVHGPALDRERCCYVCKRRYRQVHAFYHLLCEDCGDASQARREPHLDLRGRRALVTGGRVKIGYAVALGLLRSGAQVTITTRFPADAARRYQAEPDAAEWRERLSIEGLDFRRLADVITMIEARRAGPPLEILVNNAAQTVWQPPEAYRELTAAEQLPCPLPVTRWTGGDDSLHALTRVPSALDLQRVNSWVMELEEVPPVEMVEAQVVNNVVPFLLCSRLQPRMIASPFADRYIVNVAALEGQFNRPHKLSRHPHTNMAKAALNMLTRTSAEAYARQGIYMVSVDPGWMSHEGPERIQRRAREAGFHPPLDATDAAARILDPIARGLAGAPVYGVLLKDFREVPW